MQQLQPGPARLGTRAAKDPFHTSAPNLREARRRTNLGKGAGDLRCECREPLCERSLPADAEAHRKMRGGFLVVPGHQDGDVVIGAADRFFIVEPRRRRLEAVS
jgi:hypothetical protein